MTIYPEIERKSNPFIILPEENKWLYELKNRNNDPEYKPEIESISIINRFYSFYYLSCACPSCGMTYGNKITGSLLIYRNTFCPHCFSGQLITTTEIKNCVNNKYRHLLSSDNNYYTFEVKKIQNKIENPANAGSIPLLVKYMNQGTVFKLNEIIMMELLKEGKT
jgi:hypothetical protein